MRKPTRMEITADDNDVLSEDLINLAARAATALMASTLKQGGRVTVECTAGHVLVQHTPGETNALSSDPTT